MKIRNYILDDKGNPVPEGDTLKWGRWFEKARGKGQLVVKQETIGKSWVSTVFLGLDHNWGKGPPILWETMVFRHGGSEEMDRCSGSREQAEAMHERMVKRVKKGKL